jgi:CMP-N-acetylneuraminic acid synthetase
MKIVAFIPIKLNNERLPGKNLKAFDNGKPLITYILETVLKVKKINDIYVYCSSDEICNYLPSGIKFKERNTSLDSAKTTGNNMIKAFKNDVSADIYIKLHATSPFTAVESIERGINAIINDGYDCAFPVTRNTDFLWLNGIPNYNTSNIPRTQDLNPFYIETTAFYIYRSNIINDFDSRIGKNPFLIEVSKIEAIDINEPVDFEIANAIYNHILSGGLNE